MKRRNKLWRKGIHSDLRTNRRGIFCDRKPTATPAESHAVSVRTILADSPDFSRLNLQALGKWPVGGKAIVAILRSDILKTPENSLRSRKQCSLRNLDFFHWNRPQTQPRPQTEEQAPQDRAKAVNRITRTVSPMGFFQHFFDKFSNQEQPSEGEPYAVGIPYESTDSPVENDMPSSFELLDEETVDSHLRIARYSDFYLTDAVRPSYDLQVIPREAYRHDTFRDEKAGCKIPVLMISASSEKLFDLFLDLLNPLGDHVDVVLETSHAGCGGAGETAKREHIDLPVLKSIFCEYEQTLMHDGCLGIAVLNPAIPLEVQLMSTNCSSCMASHSNPSNIFCSNTGSNLINRFNSSPRESMSMLRKKNMQIVLNCSAITWA